MMRLLVVELTRIRWRRAVLLMLAAAVVLPLAIMAMTLWSTRPVSAAEMQRAVEQAEAERDNPVYQQDLQRCEKHPTQYGAEDATECEEMMSPQPEWFVSRAPLDPEVVFSDQGPGVAIVGAMLMLLAGATYIGHDWASGSMSNQLLFEPRRLQVWGAKALAIGAYAAAVALIGQVVFWLGIWLAARSRDIEFGWVAEGLDGLALRSVILVALAAVGGFALTMLFRSTVATLGILFAVAVAGTLVISLLPLDDHGRWLPSTNVLAWLTHGTEYYSESAMDCTVQTDGSEMCTGDGYRVLSFWGGARYLFAVALPAIGISIPSFLRRDVP